MDLPVTAAFTKALPKAELHAHLSGSISRSTLHRIWQRKQSKDQCLDLDDPAIALKPAGTFPTILSFFQIFNDYIYKLVDDVESVDHATQEVVADFAKDGVQYLELRTTPRAMPGLGNSRRKYVETVLEAIRQQQELPRSCGKRRVAVNLILSVDRGMMPDEAMEVVELAVSLRREHLDSSNPEEGDAPCVVGVDLCGNPTKGDVALFAPAFEHARQNGLGITVHFAEVPASATKHELQMLLDWRPDRLGHAIHIPPALKEVVRQRKLGLELCLSCNVLAKLTEGGFADHHFGEWRSSGCPIALGTDDVGVFESSLSNEYLIAAREFGLSRGELIALARSAVSAAFAGQIKMKSWVDDFEREVQMGKCDAPYVPNMP